MWKWSTGVIMACAMLVGVSHAARDVTKATDVVVGVPDDADWPAAESPNLAIDDKASTKYLHRKGDVQPTGFRVTLSVGPAAVTGMTFTSANDCAGRDPIEFELSGSNGNIDGPYTVITTMEIVDFHGTSDWPRATKTTTPITFANAVEYKHYQVLFTKCRTTTAGAADTCYNSMQIAEVELLGNVCRATVPTPADGAIGVTQPLFQWTKGDTAVLHDVYLGASPDLTEADRVVSRKSATTALYYHFATTLEPGTTYYWRVDQIDSTGTVYTGVVWQFTMASLTAFSPTPSDGSTFVTADVDLAWLAGLDAARHNVYFGTDRDAVEAGDASTVKAARQLATTCSVSGLVRGTTYYWRVDEVLSDDSVVTGSVWSFTVRPAFAKTDANRVGWWKLDDEGSDYAVDSSGYDNYGTRYGGAAFVDGWQGEALSFDGTDDYIVCGNDASLMNVESVSVSAWIQLGIFDGDRKIVSNQNNSSGGYKLGVYTNNKVEFEVRDSSNASTLNRAVEGGTTLKKNTWYHVVGVYEKGMAIRTYVNGALDRELATASVVGTSAAQVTIGREAYNSTYYWLGLMDDVRIYNKALTANEVAEVMLGDLSLASDPQPAVDASVDIRDAESLSWSAGSTAAKHDVYFGQDRDAVKTADTGSTLYQGRRTGTSFSLDGLVELGGGSYFWRIDEVESDGATVYEGTVWNFAVPGYLIVDDFESYSDAEGSRIYEFWIDGYGDQSSGSTVGNLAAPFAEIKVVHSGTQAMPLDYNNVNSPYYSEAVVTFSPVQDWTDWGVANLVLSVRGSLASDGLYIKVEDSSGKSVLLTHPNPTSLVSTAYTDWSIPLSSLTGVSKTKIQKLYLGVGNRTSPKAGGSGRIYIDDVRLTLP
ncbi:MAG TPA: LamG domain-containing protein [Sedimentisphaerales bacterium]|jgi:hypothetical protein|nr:LamG domain-containing protein [Sedimentisphaerales bacterium]HNU28902.1 LamG domain-containing protein [Sedimentisphaerales bacterium]